MSYKLTGLPTAEPLTLIEVKLHLRETEFDQDPLINSLITVAREYVENFTRRALMPQTWDLYMDKFVEDDFLRTGFGFRREIALYYPPVQSINHVTYIDTMGVTQTIDPANYVLDASSEPARIASVWGTVWPVARDTLNAINIQFVAGYADAASVPEAIKQAMKLLIGHLYENREAVVNVNAIEPPLAVKALLGAYIIKGFY